MLGILCHDFLSTFAISTTTLMLILAFVLGNFVTILIISSADANLEAQIFHQTDSKNSKVYISFDSLW